MSPASSLICLWSSMAIRARALIGSPWEPVVIIGPDSTPVTCPDCGVIYSATDDPILAACALDNHQRFHKEEAAA